MIANYIVHNTGYDKELFSKIILYLTDSVIDYDAVVKESKSQVRAHSPKGITGITGITITAIVIGSGYSLSRKNLYAIILAHALIDTWSLFSLYKGGISFFF